MRLDSKRTNGLRGQEHVDEAEAGWQRGGADPPAGTCQFKKAQQQQQQQKGVDQGRERERQVTRKGPTQHK